MFVGGVGWAGGCKTKRDVGFASFEVISSTCFFSPRNPHSGLLSNIPEFLPPCWNKSDHLPPGKGSEATVSQSWVTFGGCLREVWDILPSPKKIKAVFAAGSGCQGGYMAEQCLVRRDGVVGSTPKTSSPCRTQLEQQQCPSSCLAAALPCWKCDYSSCLLTRV